MTFVQRTRRLKPYLNKFWKRELGVLWLPFERERLIEFSRIKANENVVVRGYVKWTSDRIFALVPTLFSNQIYLNCLNLTERRPNENSYVEIYGRVKWVHVNKINSKSVIFRGVKLVEVYDWKNVKPELELPKIRFGYRDFKKDLVYRIEGLEPKIIDFLAFTALSTPSFYENVGGINLTLYDSTTRGMPRFIAREMRRVIPPDIDELCTVSTPFGKFGLRYKYAYFVADADRPITSRIDIFLKRRTRFFIRDYEEVSLGLHSDREKPLTIEDPPCGLSDIPTVVPEITTVNTKKRADPEFESFKYLVLQHMKAPVIENYNGAVLEIVNYLERLKDDYELNPVHLSKGFLNANYHARPCSIIRETLSYARANDIKVVTPKLIKDVLEEFFRWNFEYVYRIWEDLIKNPGISPSIRSEYRNILRIIRRYEESESSGVSLETIKLEAKTNPSETETLIKEMSRRGLVYEPVPNRFKRTPL